MNDETAWQPMTDEPQSVKPDKPLRPLTRKQLAFVQELVNNPKQSATQAAKKTYNVTSDLSARQQAHENLTKPNVQLELAKYQSKAEYNLMKVANKSTEYAMINSDTGSKFAAVSERANNSILDRLLGKATQRTELDSRVVTLNVDLTGQLGSATTEADS